jgi:adenosylmethionine-8-amino-7-oxononanoate aminotransferase
MDGISSWYTCSYGHARPELLETLSAQSKNLHHVVFAGMTHEPAVEFAEKLLYLLPNNQSKVFYSENGSTAVEIGLKMAFQYQRNSGKPRKLVVALENGFHGDTLGAMSASDLSVYNGAFSDFFFEVVRIPAPTHDNREHVLQQVDTILNRHEVASFIYEPLVQGAAAMQVYSADVMDEVLLRFRESGAILIADEVMTGFGKTGTHFASDQIQTKPDIMCLAKAITGGIMPMAVTSCSQIIFDAFYDDNLAKGFFHGHTYSGNPLACAVASAAIELLQAEEIGNNLRRIARQNQAFAREIATHPAVGDVRHCGTILAIDLAKKMSRYGGDRDAIYLWFWERGLFIRPLGKTLYLVPPFVSSREEVDQMHLLLRDYLNLVS